MVIKRIAGLEILGQVGVARMAGAAQTNHTGRGHLGNCGINQRGVGMGVAPFVVRLERAVTGFAAHGHFRHRRVVAVRGGIIILVQAGVVTFGAEGIPVHAPARPMAIFAGKPEVVAIDVKPLV